MPNMDKTGPQGQGPATGMGRGPCGQGTRKGPGRRPGRGWCRFWPWSQEDNTENKEK